MNNLDGIEFAAFVFVALYAETRGHKFISFLMWAQAVIVVLGGLILDLHRMVGAQ